MLADSLEHQVFRGSYNWGRVEPMMLKAAKELRRLHHLLGKANELLGASGEREATEEIGK